jgi:hypothetical protein
MQKGNMKDDDDDDLLEWGEASSTAPESISSSGPWHNMSMIHDIDKVFMGQHLPTSSSSSSSSQQSHQSQSQHWKSLNIQQGSSGEYEDAEHPPSEQEAPYSRKRVVRFWDDDGEAESLDACSSVDTAAEGRGFGMDAGLSSSSFSSSMMLVPEGTINYMNTSTEEGALFDGSISLMDVFDEEGWSSSSYSKDSYTAAGGAGADSKSSSGMLGILATPTPGIYCDDEEDEGQDDNDDTNSIDEEEDQEKQIRRSLLFAVLGMGAIGLVSYGAKKIMSVMSYRNNNEEEELVGVAGDAVGDALDTAVYVSTDVAVDAGGHGIAEGVAASSASQAAFNASASSSSSQIGFAAAGGAASNPSAATAAQYVPVFDLGVEI